MWKSLRIGAVLAVAAVGGLKLAQHFAAQSAMERITQALAPSVRLAYSDVGGALDGRVVLEAPRLEVLAGPAHGALLRATRATIDPPSTLWLLKRALGGDPGVPRSLDVHLDGATFSQEAVDRYARDGWFGATSLVPFESVGCEPVSTFSARDYARMGFALRPREDELRYSYDADARTLRADIESTAPPFSTISAHLELSSFEPSAWLGNAHAAKAQRIEQLSLTYLDGGYLAKRNRFCAQLTGTDAAGYAAHHLVAVKNFLEARGVTPSDEVATLYRKLIAEGGSAELSSLPEAAFVPADFAGQAPEDVLRQLNVTLRHNTAPPILMRLGFAEPPANPAPTDAIGEIAATSAPATEPIEASATTAPEPATETPAAPPRETQTAVVAPEPAKSEGMPLLSIANAAAVVPVPLAPLSAPPASSPSPNAADEDATPDAPAPPWATVSHPSVDPRDAVEAVPASEPPPPPGTTAALVWRAPTIERLPPKVAAASSYVSVPIGSLGAHVGSRVRLRTAGGKLVEGRLQQLDGTDVVVLILRNGGSAQVHIPWAGIRDAMVPRTSAQ